MTSGFSARSIQWLLLSWTIIASPVWSQSAPPAKEDLTFIVIQGASGEPEFGAYFEAWSDRWVAAGKKAGAQVHRMGNTFRPGVNEATNSTDLADLRQFFTSLPPEGGAVWILLHGHGTFDGKESRFNLRGEDLTASEFQKWLLPMKRMLVIVNAAASSAPFLTTLSGTNRVIITATRSGQEANFSRFGEFLSLALTAPEADIDQDGQTSLLELYLHAAKQLEDFYKQSQRLASEHALLDDNGDKVGTEASWFKGVRAVKRSLDKVEPDGRKAHQIILFPNEEESKMSPAKRAERDALELEIIRLRDQKSSMDPGQYQSHLEGLLLKMAKLYEAI